MVVSKRGAKISTCRACEKILPLQTCSPLYHRIIIYRSKVKKVGGVNAPVAPAVLQAHNALANTFLLVSLKNLLCLHNNVLAIIIQARKKGWNLGREGGGQKKHKQVKGGVASCGFRPGSACVLQKGNEIQMGVRQMILIVLHYKCR